MLYRHRTRTCIRGRYQVNVRCRDILNTIHRNWVRTSNLRPSIILNPGESLCTGRKQVFTFVGGDIRSGYGDHATILNRGRISTVRNGHHTFHIGVGSNHGAIGDFLVRIGDGIRNTVHISVSGIAIVHYIIRTIDRWWLGTGAANLGRNFVRARSHTTIHISNDHGIGSANIDRHHCIGFVPHGRKTTRATPVNIGHIDVRRKVYDQLRIASGTKEGGAGNITNQKRNRHRLGYRKAGKPPGVDGIFVAITDGIGIIDVKTVIIHRVKVIPGTAAIRLAITARKLLLRLSGTR